MHLWLLHSVRFVEHCRFVFCRSVASVNITIIFDICDVIPPVLDMIL